MKDIISAIVLLFVATGVVIWQANEGNEQAIIIVESIAGESHDYQRTDP